MNNLLNLTIMSNNFKQVLFFIVTACILFFASLTLKKIFFKKFKAFAEKTKNQIDDLIYELLTNIKSWFIFIISFYISSFILTIPIKVQLIIQKIVSISILLQIAFILNYIIIYFILKYKKEKLEKDPSTATLVLTIGFIVKIILWSIILLLILDNLGIKITTLIAGLGVGGIAVALAVQNVLGDLFASLSIVLDKPFVLGDFIIVGDLLGTVEHIGLKTTRIRSLSGEQIVFSNTDLLNSRIRNFKRMYERRVVFSFGILYETPIEKIKIIPQIVKNIIEGLEHTRFDRAHFKEFGDSSLNFEVVYYVLVPDYNIYMDIQQKINITLYEEFKKINVEFAYPTQTLYINK